MADSIELLSEELKLPCGATLPNRIAKSAMSEILGDADNAPSDALSTLYGVWGRGGTGLLVTGNVIVARGGRTEPSNVVLDSDRHLTKFARWASAAQAGGARLWAQLNHAGRQSPRMVTWAPVAPSAVSLKGMGGLFSAPRPLEDAEIRGIIERFAQAASVVKAAGFHGVQIHGAHGYLVSQFLSPLSNVRTDRWGGDIDGRMRFVVEITRAIRKAVGPAFPVGIKLNSADFQRGGFTLEESMHVAQALEAEGIDLIEVSGGTYEQPKMVGVQRESTRKREAYFLEYAAKIREVTTVPLMVTGGFRSTEAMGEALASKAVDLVGIARPLTIEPDLPARLLAGQATTAKLVEPRVGIKLLDSALQTMWYQAQLLRIAHGQDPKPNLGAWSTLLRAFARAYYDQARGLVVRPPPDQLEARTPAQLEGAA